MNTKITFLFFTSLFLSATSFGKPSPKLDPDQTKRLEEIIKKTLKGSDQFSIVLGLPDHTFERAAHELLMPASTTKVATAFNALERLAPGTKVQTSLLASAPIQKETLKGDLYFRGGGDPGFVSESLWKMVNDLSRTGLKTITGDIVVDDQLFDHVRFDESREDLRVERAYDAPVGALSFNWNSVNVYVRPGPSAGEKALVALDPENEFTILENNVKTTTSAKTEVDIERVEKGEHDLFKVKGQIRADEPEKVYYRSITRPDLWAGYQLKNFLLNRGIQLQGKVRAGLTQSSAIPLISNESKPIESMVIDMDKFSNNFVAEMLTKLVSIQTKTPGSIAGGMKSVAEKLDSVAGCKGEHSLVSPSGLTRRNRISTRCLWSILNTIKQNFNIAPEYMSSFPIAGVDGTMKNRLKTSAFRGTVRAKTGSIDNVVALAGFFHGSDPANPFVPFAIIYNGNQDEWKIRDFFDSLLQVVAQPNG